ncbi:MAG: M15 family metallopeptidase [Deltaproteobacteria bacterium]|nr:M15 family metallopeptidase [Deltaproteobacteria bacterium]
MNRSAFLALALALIASLACEHELDERVPEEEPIDTLDNVELQGVYDCSERADTGYRSGNAFAINVVTVDGRPVERSTANAYIAMQGAAAGAGVDVRIVSGFRTMAEQERLYSCYVNCNCNNCNLAARPGTSNHQSGHALDLNTSASGVLNWLNNNGGRFGFSRTVPSEAWHWEWWGSSSDYPGPCGGDQRCFNNPNFGGCEGSVVTRCDENNQVGSGDCGFFGASCSTAGGAPHCVNPYCTVEVGGENGTFCVDGTDRLATCTQGQVSEGDCGFFGASCSEAGGAGHCVHPLCPMNLDGAEDGRFCVDDTQLATCTLGRYEVGDCAGYGGKCSDQGGGHCVHFLCWSNLDGAEDGSFCVDDGTLGSCALGVPATTDCRATGGTCVENNGSATCSVPGAPAVPVEPEPTDPTEPTPTEPTEPNEPTTPAEPTDDQTPVNDDDDGAPDLEPSVQASGCTSFVMVDGGPALLLLFLAPIRRWRRRPQTLVRLHFSSHGPGSAAARK